MCVFSRSHWLPWNDAIQRVSSPGDGTQLEEDPAWNGIGGNRPIPEIHLLLVNAFLPILNHETCKGHDEYLDAMMIMLIHPLVNSKIKHECYNICVITKLLEYMLINITLFLALLFIFLKRLPRDYHYYNDEYGITILVECSPDDPNIGAIIQYMYPAYSICIPQQFIYVCLQNYFTRIYLRILKYIAVTVQTAVNW